MIGIRRRGRRDEIGRRSEKRKGWKAIMDSKKHYWCRQRRAKFRAADPRNMFKIIHVKNSNKIWSDLEELQV